MKTVYLYKLFKGAVSRDFLLHSFSWIIILQVPENNSRVISNFFENSRRYSQVKLHHRHFRRFSMTPTPVYLDCNTVCITVIYSSRNFYMHNNILKWFNRHTGLIEFWWGNGMQLVRGVEKWVPLSISKKINLHDDNNICYHWWGIKAAEYEDLDSRLLLWWHFYQCITSFNIS